MVPEDRMAKMQALDSMMAGVAPAGGPPAGGPAMGAPPAAASVLCQACNNVIDTASGAVVSAPGEGLAQPAPPEAAGLPPMPGEQPLPF